MSGYILYYDSGTSNTRAYLLDRDFQVQYTAKTAVGSKDSAISGSNAVLIQGMRALYDRVLSANGLKEEDMEVIASCIADVVTDFDGKADAVRERVNALCAKYPLY